MTRSARSAVLTLCACAAACGRASDGEPDVRPAQPPLRIVAGSVFATEVLLAIAPRERIAGVHQLAADARYSLVTAEIEGLQLVGAEPEQLLTVRPDLVVLDAFTRTETKVLLASAGVPMLHMAPPGGFDDIAANIRRIGRASHLDGAAEALVGRMQARLAALRQRGAGLGAWHVCSLDGGLHTYGRGSLFDAMLAAVGAHNLAAERGAGAFRKLSLEALLAARPDALLVDGDATAGRQLPAWFQQMPGLSLLPCTQRNRVLSVPGALLGATSHRLVDTVEFVQQQLLAWGRP